LLLSPQKAGEYLGISPKLLSLAKHGALEVRMIDGRRYFVAASLEKLATQKKRTRIDHGISVPLSPEQRAEKRRLMAEEGLTVGQARYRVLTPEQHERFQDQIDASKQWRFDDNPRAELLKRWRINERHHNPHLEFTITESDLDWPTHCPATGVELHYGGPGGNGGRGGKRGPRSNSAALDRIDNTRGCVPGNVVIVSQWVNIRKGDATPELLRKIADFYSRGPGGHSEPWDVDD
jgi:hypothetical protein